MADRQDVHNGGHLRWACGSDGEVDAAPGLRSPGAVHHALAELVGRLCPFNLDRMIKRSGAAGELALGRETGEPGLRLVGQQLPSATSE
jgi:hypothetical protein